MQLQLRIQIKNLGSKRFPNQIQSGSFRFPIQNYMQNCSLLYTVYLNSEFIFSLDPLDSESRFRVILLDLQFRLRMFLDPAFIIRSEFTFSLDHLDSEFRFCVIILHTNMQRIYCADLVSLGFFVDFQFRIRVVL